MLEIKVMIHDTAKVTQMHLVLKAFFLFFIYLLLYIFFFKQCVLVDITQICQTLLLLNPLLFSLVIVYFKVQTNVLHVIIIIVK